MAAIQLPTGYDTMTTDERVAYWRERESFGTEQMDRHLWNDDGAINYLCGVYGASLAQVMIDIETNHPTCGAVVAVVCGCGERLRILDGKFGAFVLCRSCGFKTSWGTKKFKALEEVKCGTALSPAVNPVGIVYAGCKKCKPGNEPSRPIREFIG